LDIEHYKNWLKLGDGLASKQNGKGPSNILTRILIILLVILFVIILIVVAATLLGVKRSKLRKKAMSPVTDPAIKMVQEQHL